jgi:hypothetical protein
MHQIDISGYKKLQYASCIEELSADEFEFMFRLYLMQQQGEIDIDYFRFMLTVKLLGIKKTVKYYTMSPENRELVNDNINRLVETIDSFYEHAEEDGKLVKKLNLKWIKQMLPSIGKLIGPADALTNCTIYEYKEALSHYSQYVATNYEIHLNHLIATLYRPTVRFYTVRKWFGQILSDPRQPFNAKSNPIKITERANKINALPKHLKLAVLLWFGNCVDFIATGRPTIDGIEMDFSILFSKKTDSDNTPAGIGLTGVIYSLAESSVFGNAEQTGNTNLYDVLVRLYQLKLELDALKDKNNKHNDKD